MDLTQKKLSKAEWNNVEVPFPDEEKNILKMIVSGFHNIHIRENNSMSLLSLMKLDPTIVGLEVYLFKEYFEKKIKDMIKQYTSLVGNYETPVKQKDQKNKLKKGDHMRINNINKKMDQKSDNVFENILLQYCENILQHMEKPPTYTMLKIRVQTSYTQKQE